MMTNPTCVKMKNLKAAYRRFWPPPKPIKKKNRVMTRSPKNAKRRRARGKKTPTRGSPRRRKKQEKAPARVDESDEKQCRERRLDETEAEGDELRCPLGCPNEPSDDRADEGDQDEEAQDVRHLIDPAPTTNAGGKSVRT